MEVGIVAQRGNVRAAYLAGEIRDALRAVDADVRIDEATASELGSTTTGRSVDSFDECDLAVSIGGDGTFLFAARRVGGTPILGVNLGEVGFLNAVRPGDAIEAVLEEVDAIREGTFDVREAPRLAARCDGWESTPAANEVVVTGPRRGHGGGIGFEVRIDGSLYSSGHADGILVSTPTGSTAYNLSEGGPIVHPSIEGLIVTEMCSAGGMPSVVVAGDCEIRVSVTDATRTVVVSDGREPHELDAPTEVRIGQTDPPVRIAGPVADFFEALGKLS
ncbi:MAG: NAD(+)/NADH kinase [Natrialbaceae archaeon]